MSESGIFDWTPHRDSGIAALALDSVVMLAWAYLILMAGMPMEMATLTGPAPTA